MAVTALSATRYGPRRWEISITVDGSSIQERVLVPEVHEFGTNKEYLIAHAKSMVRNERRRLARRAARLAEEVQWDEETATDQSTDAADILADIQAELDA